MNSQEYLNLSEAYLDVYDQEEVLDEVTGRGKIDAVANIPSIGERGSRTSTDAGMQMPPLERAKARANALKRRNDPEATKRANRINSRFVNPTNSAINRSLLAATNAKHAEKTRLQKLNNSYDLFDYIMEYLITEGYADTNENALVIMANMSEKWRQSIVEGKSDRPLGYMHPFARGMKQPKGEKSEEKYGQDTEGNITGKYLKAQKSKRST
jgi:hypothetical protein